jgi:hypothetical protein
VMKTKSAVRPREIQRTVLDLERLFDLERLGWVGAAWKLPLFSPQMVRRDEGRRGARKASWFLV